MLSPLTQRRLSVTPRLSRATKYYLTTLAHRRAASSGRSRGRRSHRNVGTRRRGQRHQSGACHESDSDRNDDGGRLGPRRCDAYPDTNAQYDSYPDSDSEHNDYRDSSGERDPEPTQALPTPTTVPSPVPTFTPSPTPVPTATPPPTPTPTPTGIQDAANRLFVDPVRGSDDNDGKRATPFLTFDRALQAAQALGSAEIYIGGGQLLGKESSTWESPARIASRSTEDTTLRHGCATRRK